MVQIEMSPDWALLGGGSVLTVWFITREEGRYIYVDEP